MSQWTPKAPRICSRCSQYSDEGWRLACERCGGLVVANVDRGLYFRIRDRAWRDGWTDGQPERNAEKGRRRQAEAKQEHRPITFPMIGEPHHE